MKSGAFLPRFTSTAAQNKAILCIVLLALCIRMAFFIAQMPWDEQALHNRLVGHGDALAYHRLGLSFLQTKSFVFWNTRTIIRPPGYPLFLSLVYFVFGPNTWSVLLIQALLDTMTVVLVYFIARELFASRAKQNIAAFLYAISFLAAHLTARLLSETFFTFVFVLSILFFIRALKTGRIAWYILSGCVIGVAALTRQAAIYVPVIFCIVLLLQRRKLIARFLSILIIVVAFFATLSPWLIRNKVVFGHLALTNHTGFILGWDNAATVKAQIENITKGEARRQLAGDKMETIDDPFEKSRIWKEVGLEYLSNNLMSALKYNIKGVIYMFAIPETNSLTELFGIEKDGAGAEDQNNAISEGIIDKVIKSITHSRREYFIPIIMAIKLLLEYVFLVIGFVVMFRSKQALYAAFFALLILYFGLLPGIQGMARYKIQIVPIYLVLSANGAAEFWKYIRNKWTFRK